MLVRFYGGRSVSPTGKTGDAEVEAAHCFQPLPQSMRNKLYYHAFVIGVATSPRHGGQNPDCLQFGQKSYQNM